MRIKMREGRIRDQRLQVKAGAIVVLLNQVALCPVHLACHPPWKILYPNKIYEEQCTLSLRAWSDSSVSKLFAAQA